MITNETPIKVAEAPKQVLEKNQTYWQKLGPGLITGAADDDPSGIATYSQVGAAYGFKFLWLSLFTFPLMAIVQEMCARIALVTGRGLAGNIRKHYSSRVLYVVVILLCFANTLNIGADLGAMAQAFKLIIPNINIVFAMIMIGVVGLLLQVFLTYRTYAKYLKWITLILFAYVVSMFFVHLPFFSVIKSTFTPSMIFSKDAILLITGVLGTTISPYLFFWQTSQEIEEEILNGKTTIKALKGTTNEEISGMRTDVWSGMFFSNFVMFCIIAVCGATLYTHGITSIGTAADAALALRPIAGEGAYLLFALGIIGTGLLAVPILAGSTSYAFAESFGWKQGLYYKFSQAKAFYGVIILSVVVGLGINFLGIDPIKALIYSAVLNGVIAPVMIYFILDLSSNNHIMGEFKNSTIYKILGWIAMILMSCASIATVVSLFL